VEGALKICVTPEVSEPDTEKESPPVPLDPQVMTEPSVFRAAKAVDVLKIWVTPEVSEAETEEESPPRL
jgi:hypothetical protein